MYCGEKPFHHIKCIHSPMKPPLAMLTYSLFFCKRKLWISKEGATTPFSSITQVSHTCRKCASTMFIYMSSSSLPLPMKHKCSPLAMEPDSKDCFCASRRDFTERANSEGFWSICAEGKDTHHVNQELRTRWVFKFTQTHDSNSWLITQTHDFKLWDMARLFAQTESVFFCSPGQSPNGRLWTDAQNCTALQAYNPPRRIGRRPESEITYLNDSRATKLTRDEYLIINDLLVGL